MKIIGVYKILNTVNQKSYIGQSINIESRFKQHISKLTLRKHKNYKLQEDWNNYSKNSFEFSILESCKLENLVAVEQKIP